MLGINRRILYESKTVLMKEKLMDEAKLMAYIEELNSMALQIENDEDNKITDGDTLISIGINAGLLKAICAFKRHFMND